MIPRNSSKQAIPCCFCGMTLGILDPQHIRRYGVLCMSTGMCRSKQGYKTFNNDDFKMGNSAPALATVRPS